MRLIAASLLSIAAASACRAEPIVQPWLMEVPFGGAAKAGADPMDEVRAMHGRIEAELRRSASSDGAKVAIGRDQYGLRGERILISAITPKRGYFAFVPTGVYEEDSAAGIARKSSGKVPVCYFEVSWSAVPKDFSVAGLLWASRLFPNTDCKLLPDSKLRGWEEQSKKAAYSHIGSKHAAPFVAHLIGERFPGYRAPQPVDLGRVIKAALDPGDRILSVVPVPSFPDARAFARTRDGKTLLAISASDAVTGCVIEGLSWDAAAERFGPERRAAEELCTELLAEWKRRESERLMRDAKTDPPILKPVERY